MAEFRNEFSWSKSRDILFLGCKRKYWFNHYGFWGGWDGLAKERVKRIYYLKKLINQDIWVGARVHETIQYILNRFRSEEEVGLGFALKSLRRRMESDVLMSRSGGYSGFASRAHRFFEDEYGEGLSDEEVEESIGKAEKCLRNFYNSDVFMEIRKSDVSDWITLEEFLSFDFEGTKVFLSIDFAMWQDGKIILYDWKTGEERRKAGEMQLGLYAFYLAEKFGVAPSDIEAKLFYLGIDGGKVDEYEISKESLDEVKVQMRNSILEMKKKLWDISENEANEEDFEKDIGSQCERCNFRKICLGEWSS